MFRRLESKLPPDFHFADNLEGLGYFINDQDQIRMIEDPSQVFHYHASKNERYVERQREAYNECVRKLINQRLGNLNVRTMPLPPGTPADEPHIPILASINIEAASRIVVYVGEGQQDIAWLAGRMLNQEGINKGSAISFAYDVLVDPLSPMASAGLESRGSTKLSKDDMSKNALVIANPGQLIWYRRGKQALSFQSWNAISRKYGPGDGPMMSSKNRVARNVGAEEHVQCLFDEFLLPLSRTGVKIDIIAVGDGMQCVIDVLDRDWAKWKDSVEAIVCCTNNTIYDQYLENDGFREFWGKRGRLYVVDDSPLGTPMSGRKGIGCNIFSSGIPDFLECVMPRCYSEFLDYFKLVHANPGYEQAPQDILEPDTEAPATWQEAGVDDVDIDVELSDEELEAGSKNVAQKLGRVASPARWEAGRS